MRRAACNALPQLVEKGEAANIVAVTSCLKDGTRDVRLAAWNALPQLAEKDDAAIIAAVIPALVM